MHTHLSFLKPRLYFKSMLKWEKIGHIFSPKEISSSNTHAQVPFAIVLEDKVRVFFTSRPPKDNLGNYISYIYFVDLDINDPTKIINTHDKPLLDLGDPGSFDEFGTMPCSVIKKGDELWLYYVGWTRMITVPYNCANGLAVSKDFGITFHKYSQGPIMGQSLENPFLVGCPRVSIFDDKLYMWYIGGTGWVQGSNKYESMYNIKLAVSDDGVKWDTIDNNVINQKYEGECQTSVTVFKHENLYHMYFTYRHGLDFRNPERGYRIGYAYSKDLKNWERNDELSGISLSKTGWDSEMICYPHVFNVDEKVFMLYCGNQFGVNGFGIAVLSQL